MPPDLNAEEARAMPTYDWFGVQRRSFDRMEVFGRFALWNTGADRIVSDGGIISARGENQVERMYGA
jgi:hypothetical protein